MPDFTPQPEVSADPPNPGLDRILAILAWLVIAGLTLVMALGPMFVGEDEQASAEEESAGRIVSVQDEMAGKIVVAVQVMSSDPQLNMYMGSELAPLETGTPGQRLAWVIMQGYLDGMAQGLEDLDRLLDEPGELEPLPAEDAERVRAALQAGEPGGAPLDAEQVDQLDERFGFFGQIAAGFSDEKIQSEIEASASRGGIAIFSIGGLFLLGGVAGCVILLIMFILALTGSVKSRVAPIVRSGVYAETFAVWFVLFVTLQILVGFLGSMVHEVFAQPLALSFLVFFLSLAALGWPLLRGRSWTEVRTDIGWTMGRNPLVEIFAGLGTWSMALPFMGLGLLLTLLLSLLVQAVTGSAPEPSHPIQSEVLNSSGFALFSLFFVACVAAPVVEETVFRGVLYGHLRNATRGMQAWISIVIAILVSSFIFAAIHPQGLVFIPPLGGLAAGFCIGRELRGSLIAPMVAHGFSNAVVLSINVALFM